MRGTIGLRYLFWGLTSHQKSPPSRSFDPASDRSDLGLPDKHGQIWTELKVLAQQDAD